MFISYIFQADLELMKDLPCNAVGTTICNKIRELQYGVLIITMLKIKCKIFRNRV